MGLHDRDWYQEAIASKSKKNQKVIGPIWTPEMLEKPSPKRTLAWWIGRLAGIAVIAAATIAVAKLIFGR